MAAYTEPDDNDDQHGKPWWQKVPIEFIMSIVSSVAGIGALVFTIFYTMGSNSADFKHLVNEVTEMREDVNEITTDYKEIYKLVVGQSARLEMIAEQRTRGGK